MKGFLRRAQLLAQDATLIDSKMAPRIFITGVTGYIGGDVLANLHKAHPDHDYHALIRTQDKADGVKKAYPNVTPVLGGLDDYKIIKEQAAKADIVIRMAITSP